MFKCQRGRRGRGWALQHWGHSANIKSTPPCISSLHPRLAKGLMQAFHTASITSFTLLKQNKNKKESCHEIMGHNNWAFINFRSMVNWSTAETSVFPAAQRSPFHLCGVEVRENANGTSSLSSRKNLIHSSCRTSHEEGLRHDETSAGILPWIRRGRV